MLDKRNIISVVGLGYVGLPMAAIIASRGYNVVGVDVSAAVVERTNTGVSHILEPDLDIVVRSTTSAGMLRAQLTPEPADAFIIAVPTPTCSDHAPDLRALESALASVAPVLKKGDLIVIESTAPVGTTVRAVRQLETLRPDLTFPLQMPNCSDVQVAYCPERILPGQTLRELTDNARIIGGADQRSAERARELYGIFVKGEMVLTDAASAEMSKLAENAFRDVNIAYANELSVICHRLDVDPWKVIELANLHPRVGILSPGPGVGGHCIPVDPWFIVHSAPEYAKLIRCAREVNETKTTFVLERIIDKTKRMIEPVVALLGLTYKPNVDDLRESPAIALAEQLVKYPKITLLAVEPHITALPASLQQSKRLTLTPLKEALQVADIVVVLVMHNAFKAIEASALSEKIVIDTVGLVRR
ncbi:MAG TPA: UDP-N-acetyl-D-mannosamine dehydrogenase [Stellaceae bacterium]|nr:UDP-N-acetyl-D-mannosamine dehydrogenase [Stellaceae bacterium]